MKTIFIVGKPFSDQISYLRDNNYKIGLFADKDVIQPKYKKTLDYFVECDFDDKNFIDKIKLDFKIDGLIARYENYVYPKSIIAKKLGLPATTISSAMDLTDKFRMRQKFLDYDTSITPKFKLIENIEEGLQFANEIYFPVITKPTNLVKSLLVLRSNSKKLAENLKYTFENIKDLYKKFKVYRKPRVIMEEFMTGTKHSLAMFADSKGTIHSVNDVADLTMAFDIGIDDGYIFARTIPSALDEEQVSKIKEVATKGMKALKISSSPAHVELIYTDKGPKIIEIGGRIGGYRSNMHRWANNVDLDEAEVMVALGQKIDLNSKSNKYVSVLELLPDRTGKFAGIENEDLLKQNPNVTYEIKRKLGDTIGKAQDGFKFTLKINVIADNKQDHDKAVNDIKKVKVIAK